MKDAPVQWRLMLTVGQPGDPTDDATVPWPAGRNQIEAGVLTVMALQSEDEGACGNITFDPLVLPAVITASDDPLLSVRSSTYARSFNRRESETKPPSAVRPGKGG